MKNQDHIACQIGALIKKYRQRAGFVAREFAEKVGVGPAVWAEIEIGINFWLNSSKIALNVLDNLELSAVERTELIGKIRDLRTTNSFLRFCDVFEREDLRPVVGSRPDGLRTRFNLEEQEQILDIVFKEME